MRISRPRRPAVVYAVGTESGRSAWISDRERSCHWPRSLAGINGPALAVPRWPDVDRPNGTRSRCSVPPDGIDAVRNDRRERGVQPELG